MSIFTTELIDTSSFSNTTKMAIEIAFQIINSILVIIIGFFCIFIIRKIITAFFRTSSKKFPEQNSQTAISVLTSISKYAIYFFMAFQILSIFKVSMEPVLAVAGMGSIAIGFGARTIAEDFIMGASILFENQFRVGDVISINDKTGTVETIGLRITTIRDLNGDVHIFPNSTIKLVTNMSKSFNRALVEVPVSYEEDINRVLAILKEEMTLAPSKHSGFIKAPIVQGVVEMNNQYILVRILADCKISENWSAERELRRIILTRFQQEGVKPPYPHQFFHQVPHSTK